MFINIKKITGQTILINMIVNHDTNIYTLKEKIYEKDNIAIETQKLIFCGKILNDNDKIKPLELEKYCCVHLVIDTSQKVSLS